MPFWQWLQVSYTLRKTMGSSKGSFDKQVPLASKKYCTYCKSFPQKDMQRTLMSFLRVYCRFLQGNGMIDEFAVSDQLWVRLLIDMIFSICVWWKAHAVCVCVSSRGDGCAVLCWYFLHCCYGDLWWPCLHCMWWWIYRCFSLSFHDDNTEQFSSCSDDW